MSPVTDIINDEKADDVEERDHNQKAATTEQNWELRELPQMNINGNETDNNFIEGNPDGPTIYGPTEHR